MKPYTFVYLDNKKFDILDGRVIYGLNWFDAETKEEETRREYKRGLAKDSGYTIGDIWDIDVYQFEGVPKDTLPQFAKFVDRYNQFRDVQGDSTVNTKELIRKYLKIFKLDSDGLHLDVVARLI